MAKYDYSIVADAVEKNTNARYSSMNKTKTADELGITRVTLYRWLDKYYNDIQGHRDRYGDVMVNMWREDLPEDEAQKFINKNSNYDMFLCDGAFLVPYFLAADIYAAKWYKELKPTNWKKKVHDKKEIQFQQMYARMGKVYKRIEYED